jgi:hypothetical protein
MNLITVNIDAREGFKNDLLRLAAISVNKAQRKEFVKDGAISSLKFKDIFVNATDQRVMLSAGCGNLEYRELVGKEAENEIVVGYFPTLGIAKINKNDFPEIKAIAIEVCYQSRVDYLKTQKVSV